MSFLTRGTSWFEENYMWPWVHKIKIHCFDFNNCYRVHKINIHCRSQSAINNCVRCSSISFLLHSSWSFPHLTSTLSTARPRVLDRLYFSVHGRACKGGQLYWRYGHHLFYLGAKWQESSDWARQQVSNFIKWTAHPSTKVYWWPKTLKGQWVKRNQSRDDNKSGPAKNVEMMTAVRVSDPTINPPTVGTTIDQNLGIVLSSTSTPQWTRLLSRSWRL